MAGNPELDVALATIRRLNRRCQSAEAALNMRVEDWQQRSKGALRGHYFDRGREFERSKMFAPPTDLERAADRVVAQLTPKETPDGEDRDRLARDRVADAGDSVQPAHQVTPDAALLEEADQLARSVQTLDQRPAWQVAEELASALRASLDREREMQERLSEYDTATADDPWGLWGGSVHHLLCNYHRKPLGESFCNCPIGKQLYYANQRAEQAERERDALAVQLQRLKEGQP